MSGSTDKRKREDPDIENDDSNESTSSESSEKYTENGDRKIFRIFIKWNKDLNVLKTCRLICKSWNKFACRALRKLPWVYFPIEGTRPHNLDGGLPFELDESEETTPDYNQNRLQLLVQNNSLGLPSPFVFRIYAGDFRNPFFQRILQYIRETKNKYLVQLHIKPEGGTVDPIDLQTVLRSNQNSFKITQLFIYCVLTIGEICEAEKIRLPYLKLLAIGNDNYISDSILGICGNLCQFSPLESLQIGGTTSGANLRKVMLPGGCQSVQSLSLKFISINSEDCKYVCARVKEIPCIKRLQLYLRQLDNYNYNCANYQFESVIEHFADSLESLTGDCLPIFKSTNFPKLREINFEDFRNFNREFSYPLEKYPLLKKVTFVFKNVDELDYPYFEEACLGIEELSVKFLDIHGNQALKFISLAGIIFPNVSRLYILQPFSMTSLLLAAIRKSFTKLTTFEFWGKIKHSSNLSGLPIAVKTEWLENGWPLEKVLRAASLLDFPGLEKLSFGPGISMSEDLFIYSLSKMPNLQDLTFYMNEMVSAEIIRDSVGHLKRITIVMNLLKSYDDSQNVLVKEIERLRIMLPSVVEIRKVRKPSELSLGLKAIQAL